MNEAETRIQKELIGIVGVLSELRGAAGAGLDLLATKIEDRPGLILSRRFQLPPEERFAFVGLFSRANSVLKEFT